MLWRRRFRRRPRSHTSASPGCLVVGRKSVRNKIFLLLFIYTIITIIFVVAEWFLDFAIWYGHTYMYVPFPGLWALKVSKGDAVNIAYYVLNICYALGSAYAAAIGYFIAVYRNRR